MARLQGVLFDKDGTLLRFADAWGAWCERVVRELAPDDADRQRALAAEVGYDTDAGTFVTGSLLVNASADETIAAWSNLVSLSPDEIEQIGLAAMENLPVKPAADLEKLFDELKSAGLKIGLATNDYESVAHQHLAALGVARYFDFVCGFDSGYGSKPAAGMIEAFCAQTGCEAANIAMVGDSTHDLHAARAAGVGLRVGVLTGPAVTSDLEADAHVVLPDVASLPKAFAQRGLT